MLFSFFLRISFSLRTDEMFFCFISQYVESVSYRLEDLKSGTVKVRSFFLLS